MNTAKEKIQSVRETYILPLGYPTVCILSHIHFSFLSLQYKNCF